MPANQPQSNLTPPQLWEAALGQLGLQMTQATFETWVKDTELLSVEADRFVIGTTNEFAKEWLEHRLFTPIERTLSSLTGQSVELEFVLTSADEVRDEPPTLPPANGLAPSPSDDPQRFSPPCDFARQIDFEQLWSRSGFTQIPDYAIRFWRIYLGRAFDLWEFLISEDRRDVKKMRKQELPYWTPPKRYSYRSLASILGCGRKTLTGRMVPCWIYENKKEEARVQGQPLPEPVCCGKYELHEMRLNNQEEYECVHWLEGLLERLYREGLIAVERVQRPGKPRAHQLRLQAWRLVPLLTPYQVAQFKNEIDQVRHKHWLEQYGHHCQIDLSRWEEVAVWSMVTNVSGYEWGRELRGIYINNPLLSANGRAPHLGSHATKL